MKTFMILTYDLLSTHDATEHDDDQYAAHDKTGIQVIVVLRFRNIFIYQMKGPHILSLLNICHTEGRNQFVHGLLFIYVVLRVKKNR